MTNGRTTREARIAKEKISLNLKTGENTIIIY